MFLSSSPTDYFMAVEAGRLPLLPPQLLHKQIMTIDAIDKHSNEGFFYNAHSGYGMAHPLSGTTTAETLIPMYASAFTDSINHDPLKADSGLTYSLPVSRKRSRDSSSMCPLLPFSDVQNMNRNLVDRRSTFTFLGEDISSQIQLEQLEIDQFVARQAEKLRADIEERRKRNSRTIIAAVEEGISKRLRAKEEEIVKMAKLNWALEEKVKSLCIENQIWRELAQTNEATANALRCNLKQVLEQVVQDEYQHRSTKACEDDAESCCESNNERCTLAEQDSISSNRRCKNCGKEESCVLLLPCRHLCLCTVCASSVNICPICRSTKNISVHVHMS